MTDRAYKAEQDRKRSMEVMHPSSGSTINEMGEKLVEPELSHTDAMDTGKAGLSRAIGNQELRLTQPCILSFSASGSLETR